MVLRAVREASSYFHEREKVISLLLKMFLKEESCIF